VEFEEWRAAAAEGYGGERGAGDRREVILLRQGYGGRPSFAKATEDGPPSPRLRRAALLRQGYGGQGRERKRRRGERVMSSRVGVEIGEGASTAFDYKACCDTMSDVVGERELCEPVRSNVR